jgi:hypothetical protein
VTSTHALTKVTTLNDDDVVKIALDPANSAVAETDRGVTVGTLLGQERTANEIAVSVTPTDIRYPIGNVLRYGADPTGATDSASAIRDCLKVLNNARTTGNSGVYGSFAFASDGAPECFFPSGVYTIGSSLTTDGTSPGVSGIHYRGEQSILVDTTQLVTCFGGLATNTRFEGLILRGFATWWAYATANVTTMHHIIDCKGISPGSFGVLSDTNSASTHMIIKDSYFQSNDTSPVLFDTKFDRFEINNCWIQSRNNITFQVRNRLRITNSTMIPNTNPNTGQTWVELASGATAFYEHSNHWGGEFAGRTLIRNRADADAVGDILPVVISIGPSEGYTADAIGEFYGLPNNLTVQIYDDSPALASDQFWFDPNITDAEIKDWARYGVTNIDPRSGRARAWGNETIATMLGIKNRKIYPASVPTKTVPLADVVASGDQNSGFGPGGNCTPTAGTNEYGAVTQIFTANDDNDNCSISDTDFLVESELSKRVYTYCHEITWTPASNLGQLELFVDVGYERYLIDLKQGTHTYSFPFLYLNGGSGSDDTDLDRIFIQTGARMLNGDVLTFGRWYLVVGEHHMADGALHMTAGAPPGASHFGSTGPNASFFIGDEIIENVPATATPPGWISTAKGDAGTEFIARANLA